MYTELKDTLYDIIIVGLGPNGIYLTITLNEYFRYLNILTLEKTDILNNVKQYPNIRWHSKMNELKITNSEINNNYDDNVALNNNEIIKYYKSIFNEKKDKINYRLYTNVTKIENTKHYIKC